MGIGRTRSRTEDTVRAIGDLVRALDAAPLRLPLPGADSARATQAELIHQINDYLLPRMARLEAPLVAVLGGPTGSGKSTIANALAQAEVSESGVLRPTTRSPVLLCHPDDLAWFQSPESPLQSVTLRHQSVDTLTPGLAIIDAPDIDSVEAANRETATQLLAAADLWLFVTTAIRYADAVPWEYLHRARERGTSLAIIINRIPPGAEADVTAHLRDMLRSQGLGEVALYPIAEGTLGSGSYDAADEIRAAVDELAQDAEARAAVIAATLEGALRSITDRSTEVLNAATAERKAADALREVVDQQYGAALHHIEQDLASGAMLRAEVLDRWQELIGTGELMRAVQSRISAMRDRLTATMRGRTGQVSDVQGEITSAVAQLATDHADAAAATIAAQWRLLPAGPHLLGDDRSLEQASAGLAGAMQAEIRAWQEEVLQLVRDKGEGKRTTARVLAFSVNSVGVALMIVLFASTGGITGGEIAIASGTAGVSQALLNALFGEQAVRELATEANKRLLSRIRIALDDDAERFRNLIKSGSMTSLATTDLASGIHDFAKVSRV